MPLGFKPISLDTQVSQNQCDQIWRKFTSVWQIFDGLFLIWQNMQLTLAIFFALLG